MKNQNALDDYTEDQPAQQTPFPQAKKPKRIKLLLAGVLFVGLALSAFFIGNSLLGNSGGGKRTPDQRGQDSTVPASPGAQPHLEK
jgi:hypothetical protein